MDPEKSILPANWEGYFIVGVAGLVVNYMISRRSEALGRGIAFVVPTATIVGIISTWGNPEIHQLYWHAISLSIGVILGHIISDKRVRKVVHRATHRGSRSSTRSVVRK